MRSANGRFLKGHHWRKAQPFCESAWLFDNYVSKCRSTGDIATEFGVTDAAVLFWLRKHKIKRRSVSEARKIKRWGLVGPDNPMWNRRGELNPRWRGGVTAERQAFYTSREWKNACSFVWRRDKAACRRCTLPQAEQPDRSFHIHHIVSFVDKALRAEPRNLVALRSVPSLCTFSKEQRS